MDTSKQINKICYEIDDINESIKIILAMNSPEELYALLGCYNWDDGLIVPTVIANHKCCELAIAIRLYWLASADYWFESEVEVNEYNKEHNIFCKLISEKILSGDYIVGNLSHSENFDKVQLYKFKKQGLPEVFYTSVVGKNA